MVVVGVVVLASHLSLSTLSVFAMVMFWRLRPDLLATAVVGVAVAAVLGYLSFRFGTVRLLSQLDARDMSLVGSPSVHRLCDRLAKRMDPDPPTLKLARFTAPDAIALGPTGHDVAVLDASLSHLFDAGKFEALLAYELMHLEREDGLVQLLMTNVLQTVIGASYLFISPVMLLTTDIVPDSAWICGQPGSWTETLTGRVRLRLNESVGLFGFGLTVFVRSQSRKREFTVDARVAEMMDKPIALTSALRKLEWAARPQHDLSLLWVYSEVEAEDPVSDLLSAHPSTSERVERLAAVTDESMARIEVH